MPLCSYLLLLVLSTIFGNVVGKGMELPSYSVRGVQVSLNRTKRSNFIEACDPSKLKSNLQFACEDGSCLPITYMCDGRAECPDESDETFAECHDRDCLELFQCAYGACADVDAKCNQIDDCMDKSDELHRDCEKSPLQSRTNNEMFTCSDGATIALSSLCNGRADCADKSDESLTWCVGRTCSAMEQRCSYGACLPKRSFCDGEQDCADGSDEDQTLCSHSHGTKHSRPTCQPVPAIINGGYKEMMLSDGIHGQKYVNLTIRVQCDHSYGLNTGRAYEDVNCENGVWIESIPTCERLCFIQKNDKTSVVYQKCIHKGTRNDTIEMDCGDYEPVGTRTTPECRKGYFSVKKLSERTCTLDGWSGGAPSCRRECGLHYNQKTGQVLSNNGTPVKGIDYPWHVGVFKSTADRTAACCGGTVLRRNIVITAAHCFEGDLPDAKYYIGAGKTMTFYKADRDKHAQLIAVKELIMHPDYVGTTYFYSDDVALLILAEALKYDTYVQPICLDFDRELIPSTPRQTGKVVGWGTDINGIISKRLKLVELAYYSLAECRNNTPKDSRKLLTSDKICAGDPNGIQALCQGDSGGGLVFEDSETPYRHYLHGVVSNADAPKNETLKCETKSLTRFTDVIKKEGFIKKYVKEHDVDQSDENMDL